MHFLSIVAHLLALFHREIKQMSLYVACGITANAVDIGGFLLLNHLGMWYIAASLVSGVAAFTAAFLLHKHVVFRKEKNHMQHFVRFCILGLWNIVAASAILFVCVEWIGIPEGWSKIIANGSQALWGFVLMKFLVYV